MKGRNCCLHVRKRLEHAPGPWQGKVSVQAGFREAQRRWLNGVGQAGSTSEVSNGDLSPVRNNRAYFRH